jgi:protein ImuB
VTRILALWLPNWPVQRLIRAKPQLKQQPIILHHSARRGQSVVACSRAAWRLGVRVAMPLSEATALGNQYDGPPRPSNQHNDGLGGSSYKRTPLHIEPHDPFEDRKTLEEVAVWCHRFSPLVGLAEEDPVETLLLDVTGIAPLFGGEQAMNQQIESAFLQQHLMVRIGLGDTVGAAWALAHYSSVGRTKRSAVPASFDSPVPELRSAWSGLLELPIQALRLPPAIVETLNRLGLDRIGDLLPLPRNELKARFGAILLQRLDQALGEQPEIISRIHSPANFFVEWLFEHPVAQQSVIQQVIRQLIERLCFLLLKQDTGSLQLSCRLTCQDSGPATFEVGCYRPSADASHLWKLTETQLERLVLRDPVTSISVCSIRHDRLSRRQKELFDDEHIRQDVKKGSDTNCRNGPRGAVHNWCLTPFSRPLVAALIDRMASRLGRQAIVRCVLQSDAQPEKAYRYEPLVGGHGSRKRNSRRSPFSLLDRPLHLLAKPFALENCGVATDGSPSRFQYGGEQYVVSRYWGPERIETGWWRQRGVQRDYYRVETSEGFRFWIFRSLRDGCWFLQGAFG